MGWYTEKAEAAADMGEQGKDIKPARGKGQVIQSFPSSPLNQSM